ncbi:7-carboxy-7-deazaguanine synthase QueE [Parelusimicrobium proximum]|uniref:7-carboxy-7-deazaguanine synthase QueE n=1 Tax=Parelusimicrobium proximum TaxID=3228953 RepID=UPI003D186F0A
MKMPQPSYKLSEIFYSLQGEGAYAGSAAIFVRLSGCSMKCPFCDTTYADTSSMSMTADEIIKEISKYEGKIVVLTGGEPCEQDVVPLSKALSESGRSVHMETNGSIDIDRSFLDHLTVSPKKYVDEKMLKKADALKILVEQDTDLEDLKRYFNYKTSENRIFLQPVSNIKENIDLCVKLVKKYPQLRLSVQLHKLINIQ